MTKKTVNRDKRMNHVDNHEELSEEDTFEGIDKSGNDGKSNTQKKSLPKTRSNENEKKSGINFTAIAILCMFALPLILGGFLQLMDFLYPQAAAERRVRERVVRCYEAANPSKVSEVDKFIERYRGREHVLFHQLRTKYEKYPECQY